MRGAVCSRTASCGSVHTTRPHTHPSTHRPLTHLPTYLPTYLSIYLPIYLPTVPTCLPTYTILRRDGVEGTPSQRFLARCRSRMDHVCPRRMAASSDIIRCGKRAVVPVMGVARTMFFHSLIWVSRRKLHT